MLKASLVIITVLFFVSCKDKTQKVPTPKINMAAKTEIKNTTIDANQVKATDYVFFSDSILHGHKAILKYYFTKYGSDTSCSSYWHFYDKREVKENFEKLTFIGSTKNNSTKDSVFVLEPLNYCKQVGEKDFDGQAYYFTDTTLPRLQTDSYCCHPSSIFLVGDIDEDGISEIGQYYSSCASHYKSLYVYSLKNKMWKQVGHCVYDLFYMDIGKPFSYFVRKTAKNKFEMLEITDLADKDKIGKRNWLQFSM